ncbi:MAG: biotin carboxylase N-terminal domain-containing protein [Propionibacteriaceae bacterium]|nr:biotin carboxylase N-terminal domain-containing protein [Propionibacteriaceae bacterium]
MERLFIANRGEIALRIIRACRQLGVESVLAVSTADRDSLPARAADRTVVVGEPAPRASYLNVGSIVAAAAGTGCDALHPGYGFLSEDARLAEACADEGITFVGPSPDVLRGLGNKLAAREAARRADVSITPGREVETEEQGLAFAVEHGYPLMLKAVSGGGGRGIRVVRNDQDLRDQIGLARSEALAAFDDERVYIEPYIVNGRHIEVQILRDSHGNTAILGERDCSLQRRHQKVLEESPAPNLPDALRSAIYSDAECLADSVDYHGAGTVEFLVDVARGAHYFLEVNARLQVEHPVTEVVTSTDLVAEQLRVADGQPVSEHLRGGAVSPTGWAIEARVNCEDPANGFLPRPGRITHMEFPGGPGIRVDTYCQTGSMVPPYYDSLIAKVIAHGRDREEARRRLVGALREMTIEGISHNIPFLLALLGEPDVREGRIHTQWLPQFLERQQADQSTERTSA